MISEELHKVEEAVLLHGSDLQWMTEVMINEGVIREEDSINEEADLLQVPLLKEDPL